MLAACQKNGEGIDVRFDAETTNLANTQGMMVARLSVVAGALVEAVRRFCFALPCHVVLKERMRPSFEGHKLSKLAT